jgi:peptidoglycan/LPS O-acetylase OafA/YrhL
MLWYTFNGRCSEFFMGIALALLMLRKEMRAVKWPLFTLLGSAGILVSLGILASQPAGGGSLFSDGRYSAAGTLTNNLLLPAAVTILFYGLLNEGSLFRRVLSTRLLVILGKISYVFYLIHIGFISLLADGFLSRISAGFLARVDDGPLGNYISTSWLYWGMLYIVLNLISFAIYSLVEEPMNKLIKAGFGRSTGPKE